MNSNDIIKLLPELLAPVVKLAYAAGEKIMRIRENADFDIQHKDDNSPVTEADYAAHHTIVDGLALLHPQWPSLSEEDTDISTAQRHSWDTYWLIDPLDGTRDFVAGNDTFSVNIALIHNHVPVLGVIQLPVTGECFFACEQHGAWKQTSIKSPQQIHVKQPANNIPKVTISGSRKGPALQEFLSSIGEHEMYFIGSSIKSCRVAEGAIDFYPCLGPTSEWDTAAAQCIVEQAGGKMTNTKGEALTYNLRDTLINPWFAVWGDDSIDWLQHIQMGSDHSFC